MRERARTYIPVCSCKSKPTGLFEPKHLDSESGVLLMVLTASCHHANALKQEKEMEKLGTLGISFRFGITDMCGTHAKTKPCQKKQGVTTSSLLQEAPVSITVYAQGYSM